MNNRRIVLASASPRRKELLRLIIDRFDVAPSNFDESPPPEDITPEKYVLFSAREKCRDIAARLVDAIIIGADTAVSLDGRILGKPSDEDDAKRMLEMLSGKAHQVYTGLNVIRPGEDEPRELSGFEATDVRFRKLSDEIIERYVATGEPMDKAGAYAIQGEGSVLIEGIVGDFFNVVGLPIFKLSVILNNLGVELKLIPQ